SAVLSRAAWAGVRSGMLRARVRSCPGPRRPGCGPGCRAVRECGLVRGMWLGGSAAVSAGVSRGAGNALLSGRAPGVGDRAEAGRTPGPVEIGRDDDDRLGLAGDHPPVPAATLELR